MIQNPFNQEENLQIWFEKDAEFQKSRRQSFLKYIQKYNLRSNFIMNIQDQYLKLVNFITKNVFIATALMVLVVAGATVTATELILPKTSRYKPSNLLQDWFESKVESPVPNPQVIKTFSNNLQTQKDPNQLLVSDEQNYVFVNFACNSIIKYPKKLSNSTTRFNQIQNKEPELNYLDNRFNLFASPEDNMFGGYGVSMQCSPEKSQNSPFEVITTKEKIAEITGWFFTDTNIENVTLEENTNIPFNYILRFKYKDLWYKIEFQEKSTETKEHRGYDYLGGLYATQVQIQFFDQVPNPPKRPEILQNTTLSEIQTNPKFDLNTDNQPSKTDESTKINTQKETPTNNPINQNSQETPKPKTDYNIEEIYTNISGSGCGPAFDFEMNGECNLFDQSYNKLFNPFLT